MIATAAPVADILVERLAQLGVRTVFGYPGGQMTPIYDALYQHGGIRHILARHEQAAAFMADGFARATGQPGVCLAVCGPGLYNAATPLAASLSDSIPVLLLSGQVPRRAKGLRSGFYHENEQRQAAAYFTKAQFIVTSPSETIAIVDRAWQSLTDGRPGPVLLELPIDVQCDPFDLPIPVVPTPPVPPQPDRQQLDMLAALLSRSTRPLLLAGGGVVTSGAESALSELATRLGAPVFHTANGKCALPASHPLNAGMPWLRATSDLTGMEEFFSPLWKQSDFLLAIGCRFSQLATGSWTIPLPKVRVHVDIDSEEIGRHFPVELEIVADARQTLEALLAILPPSPRSPWTELPSRQQPFALAGVDALSAIRRALPAEAIVAADVTRLGYILMAALPLESRRAFLHPAGAVAMGYALPAALGARAGLPHRPILAVAGDGGFQMSAMELASMVQENLPVVVLLVNDACLTLIKSTQERKFDRRYIGVDLHNPDFELLTRAFGVAYARATNEAELEERLSAAFASGRPSLVELCLPRME